MLGSDSLNAPERECKAFTHRLAHCGSAFSFPRQALKERDNW